MAAKTISCLRLYGYVIVGLVVVKLIAGDDSASSPLSPVMGYGHFNVSNKDGKICILLDLSCSVSVQVNNTVLQYVLPLNAYSDGSCSKETSSVTLFWEDLGTSLTLSMAFTNVEEKWKATSLAFTAVTTVDNRTETNVSAVQNDSSKLVITANKEKSFQCSKSLDIALKSKEPVTVTMKKIKVQPFGDSFGKADVCSSSSNGTPAEPVDTVVPTAVGCVLAGLVIILIITYFVGRCKKPGYEKM
ncbi:lysosome-associated membrane glycoprotein 1-like [Orbicella faveolata]|uniref:lysosome-associated membrane glycoprotein 1-like n=1 Tax=Orbicella faveolata TaxID=48498 RepID=UPI0009E2A05B|nr:lysosome-associated membrane glycoprotein 1-like [Orbicella faveolata]